MSEWREGVWGLVSLHTYQYKGEVIVESGGEEVELGDEGVLDPITDHLSREHEAQLCQKHTRVVSRSLHPASIHQGL